MRCLKKWIHAFCFSALCCAQATSALTFDLPRDGSTVLGSTFIIQTITGDNATNLGRRYEVGIMSLLEANPFLKLDKSYSPGKTVLIPTQFILPNAPHKGIVINLAELRLYFYPPNTKEVMTFPVGVGRQGWNSPLGETFIARKKVDPTWIPTKHILESRLKDGVVLPKAVLPGPENPLGPYALYTGVPAILIHGSNDPSGIGRRSSSGCIRMQPEAIESFYDLIAPNTPVTIVDQPVKVGWLGNDLYVESHIPLQDETGASTVNAEQELHRLVEAAIAKRPAAVQWDIASHALEKHQGYPIKIAEGEGPIPEASIPLNPPAPASSPSNHVRPHKTRDESVLKTVLEKVVKKKSAKT